MNVVLPDKTTCISCKKTKGLNCFSELSKLDFKNGIATGVVKNPVGPWITCTSCTPKQVTELECIICYEVKGLEGFTKAQRKNPDSAVCIYNMVVSLDEHEANNRSAMHAVCG